MTQTVCQSCHKGVTTLRIAPICLFCRGGRMMDVIVGLVVGRLLRLCRSRRLLLVTSPATFGHFNDGTIGVSFGGRRA